MSLIGYVISRLKEVIRLDEESVLKTDGVRAFVGSSPTASAEVIWSCGLVGRAAVLHTDDRRFESVQDYCLDCLGTPLESDLI